MEKDDAGTGTAVRPLAARVRTRSGDRRLFGRWMRDWKRSHPTTEVLMGEADASGNGSTREDERMEPSCPCVEREVLLE
jgi:hypothetical protein